MAIPLLEPAYTIIQAFATGSVPGHRVIARIVGRHETTVIRWQYPKDRHGTGGGIPRAHVQKLKMAAQARKLDIPLDLITQLGAGEHE